MTLSEQQNEYILTKEEESLTIEHAIEQAKKQLAYRLATLQFSDMEIDYRLSATNWDEKINRQRILDLANERKHHVIWEQQQREKEKLEERAVHERFILERKLLKEEYSTERLEDLAKRNSELLYKKELFVNPNTSRILKTVCQFVSEDGDFEVGTEMSLSKGLLLRGTSGLGKTYIPTLIKDNKFNPINIVNILDITESVQEEGYYHINWEGRILYIDDIGTEQTPVKFYGTAIHWFKEFIEQYYAKQGAFNKIIISTNLSAEEIGEKYGYRVRSRMREMFNIVSLSGKDLRK